MKIKKYLFISMLIWVLGATPAWADVNEEITFTNLTGEDIYVELAVLDDSGWNFYDIWVLESNTSIANFWVNTIFSTFSACAYGELTDDFYGCIEADLSFGPYDVYFDHSGFPFLSDPPDVSSADIFLFDNPRNSTEVLVVESDHHGHGSGCFIGAALH